MLKAKKFSITLGRRQQKIGLFEEPLSVKELHFSEGVGDSANNNQPSHPVPDAHNAAEPFGQKLPGQPPPADTPLINTKILVQARNQDFMRGGANEAKVYGGLLGPSKVPLFFLLRHLISVDRQLLTGHRHL